MKIFTLIGLSIVIYGCSNINHMVDGRSRLKDLTQFGSVEQRVKSISNSLNNCPAGKMQIDYSFIDITSSHVMGQREPMPLIIGLVNDGTIIVKGALDSILPK